MENKNTQKAGDNSNQVQYTNCNINIGITEERAREIIKEENAAIIASYNAIAREQASIRCERFLEHIMPKLANENLFENLKNPEIMLAFRETEIKALCTDEEKSYELLSKLLSNRIKYSDDRLIASCLKNATEVAIQVTDEALLGITVIFLIEKYFPSNYMIKDGLKLLDNIFGIVDLDRLPKGKTWIEQLDILKLARMYSTGSMEKIVDFYSKTLNGYICVGIKKDSEEYVKAIDILEKVNLSKDILVVHELNEEYVRLPVPKEKHFNSIRHTSMTNSFEITKLSNEQEIACEMINDLYEKNDIVLQGNKVRFIKMWDQFPNLAKVRDWWDEIDVPFKVTIIGYALAYANINNINKTIKLPKIELRELIK